MIRLAVLLYGDVIGHLEQDESGDPTFAYTSEYVSAGTVPLSLRLPVGPKAFPAKRVEAYIQGLLPENSETRARWADDLGTSPDDAVGMLAEMGRDCPGAVQFCAEDDVETVRSQAHDYQRVDDAHIAQRIRDLSLAPASWTMPGEHWSLGGQQEKFALARLEGCWHEAHGSAATTHIFKPGIRVLKHQAIVEHATMRAAAALGLNIANSELISFEDQWAIVVERYDRIIDGRSVHRVHQEDMCQATGRLPQNKYESRGGPTMRDLATLARSSLTYVDEDLRAIADFAVINVVAGAPDGHSKNISVLLGRGGERFVAPLYDLATGLTYEQKSVDRAVALSIGGERHASRMRTKQWAKAAATLSMDTEVLLDRVAYLAGAFPGAFVETLAEMRSVPGADEVAERTAPELEKHCRLLVERL